MILPVEDEFNDVLSKAQKGLGISTEVLARKADVSENEIRAARRGEFDAGVVEALGRALGLNVPALLKLRPGIWRPEAVEQISGFAMVCSPFHKWKVNAFLAWDEASKRAVAFDTGSTAAPLIACLEANGLELEAVILTHAHWDHCDGTPALLGKWPRARVFMGAKDKDIGVPLEKIADGFHFELGALHVSGFDTPGHTAGGMSFQIDGLPRKVAVVGDALFAGSMGGANVSFADMLAAMQRILALDPDTVLAPGHGPLTTVAEERVANCFAGGDSALPWISSES